MFCISWPGIFVACLMFGISGSYHFLTSLSFQNRQANIKFFWNIKCLWVHIFLCLLFKPKTCHRKQEEDKKEKVLKMSQWLSKLFCKSAHYFLVRQQQLQLKVWPKYRSQVSPFYNFFNYQHPSLPPSIPPSRSYYKMSLTKKIGIFFQKSKKVKIKKWK